MNDLNVFTDLAQFALRKPVESGDLKYARGWSRVLRLARTLADLDAEPVVARRHIAEALAYRGVGAGA